MTHTHIEGNKITTHSHPYSNPNHQHSTANFNLIQSLSFCSIFSYLGTDTILKPVLPTVHTLNSFYTQHFANFLKAVSCLRAPPYTEL
ncbi:MAG: hypothetical protein EOM76_04880 [Sphingobacteriia bacterium]|nr:hypothetical protein [Sphingobacteriia bacterium]